MHRSSERILQDRQVRSERALSTLWRNDESGQIGPETEFDALLRVGLEAYGANQDPNLPEWELLALVTRAILTSMPLRYRKDRGELLLETTFSAQKLLKRPGSGRYLVN